MQESNVDQRVYRVVLNHEEQYSIWFANRPNPLGWIDAGKSGTKQECLDYIKEVWTDITPLSVRRQLEGLTQLSTHIEQNVIALPVEP